MIESVKDFGHMLTEQRLKDVLLGINPRLTFDVGANINQWHPNIERWQGVWIEGRHLTSMDRGIIPEFNVYEMKGKKIERVLRVGWRHTLERLVRANVGFTWPQLCVKLKVTHKKFNAERLQETA